MLEFSVSNTHTYIHVFIYESVYRIEKTNVYKIDGSYVAQEIYLICSTYCLNCSYESYSASCDPLNYYLI